MSDEIRPEDQIEAHAPVGLKGPEIEEPTLDATSDEQPDVEAHGPVGLGPKAYGPTMDGPTVE